MQTKITFQNEAASTIFSISDRFGVMILPIKAKKKATREEWL